MPKTSTLQPQQCPLCGGNMHYREARPATTAKRSIGDGWECEECKHWEDAESFANDGAIDRTFKRTRSEIAFMVLAIGLALFGAASAGYAKSLWRHPQLHSALWEPFIRNYEGQTRGTVVFAIALLSMFGSIWLLKWINRSASAHQKTTNRRRG
jgi:ribosomal protein L37AE/L43A